MNNFKLILTFIFFSQFVYSAYSQDRNEDDHAFHVFVKDPNGTRVDLQENEHVAYKTTGIIALKRKFIFYGKESNTKLKDQENIYIEINDTTELEPQFFRLMHLNEKKGNREMTCWSNALVLGVKDSSKDFIPTMIYPIDERTYRISIKDLEPGHYAIMYQIGLSVLMEFYDFDLYHE